MTTPAVAKLIRGAATLTLTSGNYSLETDFVPPDVRLFPLIATGTSANRLKGSVKVGERALNFDWAFSVNLNGSSEAQVRAAAAALRNFLYGAGDESNPTFLYLKGNSDIAADPLWGQAAYYYEIVQGGAGLAKTWPNADLRGRWLGGCPVALTIKPFALGKPQLVCSATGGILEDQWGTADGVSRGLIIPISTTNKMTNPVFGSATWNTGWTAGAQIIATHNTDPRFCLPQTQNSAFLQAIGAVTNSFYQVINVGGTSTHTLFALVMRPDGAAVSGSDCVLYYNVNLTTTYRNLGNGLYLLTASAAGINAGTNTGVVLVSGAGIYLLAFQIEALGYASSILWGDLLGCAWTGTAHASTSTRTAARVSLSIDYTTVNITRFSITLTWIAPTANTGYPAANYFIFDARSATFGFFLYWDATANKWTTGDGTTNFASAATTFAAGDVIVFHLTYGPTGGVILYRNGVSIANNATFTPKALPAVLDIGNISGGGNQIGGTFSDLRTFAVELTAAEVTADYSNTSKVSGLTQDVAARVGAIPWEWSNAGDNVFSPGTGIVNAVQKYNWGVFGGIPGSAPAVTQLKLTSSAILDQNKAIYLSRLLAKFFYNPATMFFADLSGTADVGTSIGDAFQVVSVNTAEVTGFVALDAPASLLTQSKEFYLFIRLKDAGANLMLASREFLVNGLTNITSDFVPIAADATMRLFKSPPQISPRLANVFSADPTIFGKISFALVLKRSVAGAANVSMDFFAILPRPLTQISFFSVVNNYVNVLGNVAMAATGSASGVMDVAAVGGDVFELEPGGYNLVQALQGSVGQSYPVTTTLTFSSVWVTPRYALL